MTNKAETVKAFFFLRAAMAQQSVEHMGRRAVSKPSLPFDIEQHFTTTPCLIGPNILIGLASTVHTRESTMQHAYFLFKLSCGTPVFSLINTI